jgi:2-phospho-L-lactate guanylyltransferase
MHVAAIVPLKALSHAKGRLSGVLDGTQREAFVAWMARRVLEALKSSDGIGDVLLVAGDDAAAAIAREAGVRAMVVEQPGLAAALAAADDAMAGMAATVVVAADLPDLTPQDIAAVLEAGATAGERAVVIAPTRDGGTGALLRRPGTVIPTAYGPGSADAHQRLAQAAGVTAVRVVRPGLANDVDVPEQLPSALAAAAGLDVGCAPRQSPRWQ